MSTTSVGDRQRPRVLTMGTRLGILLGPLVVWGALVLAASVHAPSLVAHEGGAEPYVWRNVEMVGGGFVPGIVYSQSEPDLIYARTDIGGAYRWDPRRARWTPLLDSLGWTDWNLTGVASLAADPVDPDRVYVAAGTYTNEWTSQNGAILRSADRGRTWQRTDLPFKLGGNMPGRSMGERLAIDPHENRILYLGAPSGRGLWRSVDRGVTWTQVTAFPNPGTYVQDPSSSYTGDIVGVVWVTFDPRTGSQHHATQTIYVGVADKGTSIYRSVDGGATWAAVSGQPAGFLPHHGVLTSTGFLYVSYSDGAGPYDGGKGDVWKYDTALGTWTNVSPVPSSNGGDYFGYGGLAVDAQHPDTVMVAALNSWWPDTMIWRSTNGGATWSNIWEWGPWPTRVLRYTQDISAAPWLTFGVGTELPVLSPKLGWMVGALQIDPFNSDRLLYGTGATIYGADNLTAWDAAGSIAITVKAQGLEETSVQDLICPPSNVPLLSAVGDIGGFRHDSLTVAPMMYTNPVFGTTTSLDYAESDPTRIVRVGNPAGGMSAALSSDGGTTWSPVATQPTHSSGGMVAISASGDAIVWSPGGGAVSVSFDDGGSWSPVVGLPAGARVGSDRVNPNRFYGFANGVFYLSTDAGASFAATTAAGLPASARFKATPNCQGDVWLAGGSADTVYGLWHSTDAGTSFTRVPSVEQADSIGFGKAARGRDMALYTNAQIAGVRGLYRSDDRGATWIRINDDAHQYGIAGIAITGDPRIFGRVYIGTNGRGIIYGDPQSRSRRTDEETDPPTHDR
jgi:xyloglucan-specific exo-beta-1,4-glucanase